MKTFKLIFNICVLATSLGFQTVAFAYSGMAKNVTSRGGVNGGGGDSRCAEYSDLMGKIAVAFVQIGQAKVNETLNVIQVKDIWRIKQGLRCIPVQKLDRHAHSIPDQILTKLLGSAWEKMNGYQKIRLAVHELAVLARYERDGEYYVSDLMFEILQKNSKYFKNRANAEGVIENPDGSITFIRPFVPDTEGNARRVWTLHMYDFCSFTQQGEYQSGIAADVGPDETVAFLREGRLDHFGLVTASYRRSVIGTVICKK